VRITGGVRLRNFQPVTDAGILKRINTQAKGHVLQIDLKAAGVPDFGQVAGKSRAELFFDHQYQPISRCPNAGWLRIASVPRTGELKFPGDFRDGLPTRTGGEIAGFHHRRTTRLHLRLYLPQSW